MRDPPLGCTLLKPLLAVISAMFLKKLLNALIFQTTYIYPAYKDLSRESQCTVLYVMHLDNCSTVCRLARDVYIISNHTCYQTSQ